MRGNPISFNQEMILALLGGRKSQTRRLVKPKPALCDHSWIGSGLGTSWCNTLNNWHCRICGNGTTFAEPEGISCHYGKVGDLLWVREPFQAIWQDGIDCVSLVDYETGEGFDVSYPATDGIREMWCDDKGIVTTIQPSEKMPIWASRITLEITSIRIERVSQISFSDAIAEGFMPALPGEENPGLEAKFNFCAAWRGIYGDESWNNDEWVWVINFDTHFQNIEQLTR